MTYALYFVSQKGSSIVFEECFCSSFQSLILKITAGETRKLSAAALAAGNGITRSPTSMLVL